MNKILSALKKIGGVLHAALGWMHEHGLDEPLIEEAKQLAAEAAQGFASNPERRAFVVHALTSKGVPESVARVAVEMGLAAAKKEGLLPAE